MRGRLSVSARTLREPRVDLRLRSGHGFLVSINRLSHSRRLSIDFSIPSFGSNNRYSYSMEWSIKEIFFLDHGLPRGMVRKESFDLRNFSNSGWNWGWFSDFWNKLRVGIIKRNLFVSNFYWSWCVDHGFLFYLFSSFFFCNLISNLKWKYFDIKMREGKIFDIEVSRLNN